MVHLTHIALRLFPARLPGMVTTRARLLSSSLLIACVSIGCRKKPAEPPQKPKAAPAGALVPAASHAAAAPQAGLTGTVEETMNAGGYTYLRLKTPNGDTWAAVNESKVAKGDEVTVQNPTVMEGFESKTLKRTFDRIVFGTLGAAPAEAASAPAADPRADVARAHAAAKGAAEDAGPIKVEKASGADARTVAELHAQRAALKDKPVVVRGKVVKFLPGIMSRNWLHLRDGSGSREKEDDDITVTTLSQAAVGDVVLVRGTVRTDKDFGAGYSYKVIVEDAQVTK